METLEKNKHSENNSITVFRYKIKDLEKQINQEHQAVKNEIAIPLGKDLGSMQPSKPEADCQKDVYSGPISGTYSKMMMKAKKEVQSEIESHHIIADKEEADRTLSELSGELEKKQTDLRLKNRELEKCDQTLVKKDKRYRYYTRPTLAFLMLVDTLISGTALQSMGYPLIIAYVIGLAIGVGIFFVAEHLHEMISIGNTPLQRGLIAFGSFAGLFGIFYILGIFRTLAFSGQDYYGNGISPLYFASLNLFFVIIGSLVVHFNGLKKAEKKILDNYKIIKKETEALKKEIEDIKSEIQKVRREVKESELARKQIQIYAHDLQELIQRLYEDSMKTFISTNLIHRSDGKVPKFFEEDIPMLPSFYKGISI